MIIKSLYSRVLMRTIKRAQNIASERSVDGNKVNLLKFTFLILCPGLSSHSFTYGS